MATFLHPIRFVVALLLWMIALGAQPSSLWIANDAEVRRVELGRQADDVRVPVANVIRLSATRDGGALALTTERLIRIASDGRIASSSDIRAVGYGPPSLLGVDLRDDTAWIATDGNLLIHAGADGNIGAATTLPGRASALAVAQDGTVWAAGNGRLWHFSSAAQLLQTIQIQTPGSATEGLHIDSLRDRARLVGRDRAELLDLSQGAVIAMATPYEPIFASTADVQAGVLWALTPTALIAYVAGGALLHREPLGLMHLHGATAIALDVGTGALIVASDDRLTVLGPSGIEQTRAHSLGPDLLVASRPFHMELWLTVRGLSESDSNLTRAITGEIDAICADTRCTLPISYWATIRAFTSIDGVASEGEFRVDGSSRQYRFLPSLPLMTGPHRFSAHVVDRFGQQSNEADLTFNIADPSETASPSASRSISENNYAAKAPNQAPTVTITAPLSGATFGAGVDVTLTAAASDPDGTINKVEFYRNGSTLIGTASASPYAVIWNNIPSGNYPITAKAYDNKNATTTSAPVNISVVGNLPPTVSLVAPTSGAAFIVGATIALAATAGDSDGNIARVEFYDGATLLGTAATAPFSYTWTNATVGNHALTAKAFDNAGTSAQSAIVDIVVGPPPLVVVTVPGTCSAVDGPVTITLEADAVSLGASIASVEFFDGGSWVGTVTRFPYRYALNNVSIGTHSITARATDSRGFAATSRAALVTVRSSNQPPIVSITSPSEGATFTPGATVPIAANASDADGTVVSVAFWLNSLPLRTINSAPFSFIATGLGAGNYTLTAIARDDRGLQTTSAPVHFAIASNAPPTVSMTAPANGSSYVAPATINLGANATDADGSITKVEFFAGATLIGSVTTPPYAVTWSNAAAGNYSLTAKATD